MKKDRNTNYKWIEENRKTKLLVYFIGYGQNMETQIAPVSIYNRGLELALFSNTNLLSNLLSAFSSIQN